MTYACPFNASSASERRAPAALRRALDLLYAGSAILGGLTLCLICATMLVQVIARIFGVIAGGTDEITAYACAAAAFLPLAHTLRHGDMVRLTLVLSRLGRRMRRLFELFSLTIAAAFAAYGTWHFGVLAYQSWLFGDMSQGLLVVEIWIPQLPLVIGFAVLAISLFDALVTTALGGRPSYRASMDDMPDAGPQAGG
jgi:TRAP-type C4-dicarboxylate transport system permease small subunit